MIDDQHHAPLNRRRWFQFGLGTMFLAVTLPAILLAWRAYCLDWIRQREAWRNNQAPKPTHFLHTIGNRNPPWYLQIFGEQRGYDVISLRFVPWTEPEPELTDDQLAYYREVKRLFPEATVSTSPLDSRRPSQLRVVP